MASVDPQDLLEVLEIPDLYVMICQYVSSVITIHHPSQPLSSNPSATGEALREAFAVAG